jgi:hypothetical protein
MNERYFVQIQELDVTERREATVLMKSVGKLELDSPEWVAKIRRLTELRVLTTPVALLLVRAATGDLNAEQTKEAESYGVLGLFRELRDEIKHGLGKA